MKNYVSIKLSSVFKGARHLMILHMFCFSAVLMAQDHNSQIAEIANTVIVMYEAMIKKDKHVLQELTMEKLTYGHSSGNIENQSEYVDGVLNGTFQFSSITPENQTIDLSGKIGIVRHIFNAKGTNNCKPAEVSIGCLMVFQKQGQWKLLARQAYKL